MTDVELLQHGITPADVFFYNTCHTRGTRLPWSKIRPRRVHAARSCTSHRRSGSCHSSPAADMTVWQTTSCMASAEKVVGGWWGLSVDKWRWRCLPPQLEVLAQLRSSVPIFLEQCIEHPLVIGSC